MCKIRTKANLNDTLDELYDLDQKIKELQESRDKLVSKVKDYLQLRAGKEILTEGYQAKVIEYPRTTFDTSTFKKAHMDLYESYCYTTMCSRFSYYKRMDESIEI